MLGAPVASTFDDVARALSEVAGSAVGYMSVSDDEFVGHAGTVGVPEPLARHLTASFADVRENQLDETGDDLRDLLGRVPVSLKDGLAELFTPAAV